MRAKPLDGARGGPASKPSGRRKGRWLPILLLVLGLLTGAYLFFQYQIVDTKLRPVIEKQLAQAVHAPVSIGSVRAGLTGNVVLNQVTLTIPGSPWESRLVVDQISVNVELFNLLFHRKPLENCFDRLSFIRPQIILVKNETAPAAPAAPSAPVSVASAPVSAGPVTLKVSPTPAQGGPATLTITAPGMAAPIPIFAIPKVSVRDGSFSIQAGKAPRLILQRLNFDASTENGTVWGLSLIGHSPEANSQGSLQFDGSLRLENLKVRGVVKLGQWPLASAGSTLKEMTGWELLSGTIDLESPVVFEPGRTIWYDGKADFNQAVLKSPGPVDITFSQISGRGFIRPTEIKVPQEIGFNVGETPFRASGMIPFDNRAMSVRASSDKLFLSSIFTDLLKLKDLKTEGGGTTSLYATGTLSNPLITGTAKLGPSSVGPWPLDSLSVKARYENQVLKLESANGKLFEGDFTASGFVGLTGQMDAPVSLKANLTDVEAKKVASILGWSETEGKINQEIHYSGTIAKPVFSSNGEMELTRTLRDAIVHYSIRNGVQLKDQRLQIWTTINDKSRLEGSFVEGADAWVLQKFSMVTNKKTVALTGKGTFPKTDDKPIQIEVMGKQIPLEQLPVFNDQFPDITGKVDVDLKVAGTRNDPTASAHLSSDEVSLGELEPEPMDVSLSWKPGELDFDKLEVGDIFSASGKLGFASDVPMDLKIKARGIPIAIIAEIGGWNNPPQPFKGSVTGHLHISGLKKNPIVEGDDISVDSLKVGDWYADKVTASLDRVDGKLLVKKFKLEQGGNFLAANGAWDTKTEPGTMDLHLSAHEFQLGRGPYLSGDFSWNAKTGDPFWRNWNGSFSSVAFALKDLKKNVHKFNDFSMTANCEEMVLTGKLKLGKAITGSAVLDASGTTTTVKALLKIEPVLLTEVPELTQFLPPSLKVAGNISGEIKLKKGTFNELPMEGSLIVTDGKIQDYDFDRMEFDFDGSKSKISPSFTLSRDQAKFNLSGTLESPGAFWDSDSKINVQGPIQNVKLQNILTLLKFNPEKHRVGGEVNGNLSITGLLASPGAEFSVTGQDLRYDNNLVPSAELHFGYLGGKITLEKNKIELAKGRIDIERGSAYLDPQDNTLLMLDISGSTENFPIGQLFNFTSQIHLSGRCSLEPKVNRPTFDGLLSVLETGSDSKKPIPFDVALSYYQKVIDFKPLETNKAQLVGQLDLSQDQKIAFKNLHLLNTSGFFSVDGTLDLNGGPCQLVSDAKEVPIQEICKWIFPKFPLNGTGNYHLVLNGTLDDPLFTTSISVSNGKIGDLDFDLLDGELKSHDNTLYLGDEASPLMLTRKGLFAFTVNGKMPLSLTQTGWLKVQNREMDITAKMDKGDFSLILLAGLAKKASGEMDFSAHIGGTLDNPDLTLDLDLAKCQMVPSMVAQSIEDISGRIKVRHNVLAVEDLNGRIGQGRVFISSPSIDQSKMKLVNFIPQYLDFRVHAVGDHGLWLSIPTLMDKGEWGEIYFYGDSPDDPMLIQGPLEEPQVIGTAKLETGHYTFPPKEAVDENGEKIEYRELAGVTFKLKIVSGKNTWYSNEFNTQYLELKVDPNCEIYLDGKDKDRTPDAAGIKCKGFATSKEGFLRYLGHEFKLQEGSINISQGIAPIIKGTAWDRLKDAWVLTAGGPRQMDVDVYLYFSGKFKEIDFNLTSSPPFSTDADVSKKVLYSYIMFGQDMTGLSTGNPTNYTPEELQALYRQRMGSAVGQAADDTINRIISNLATSQVRQWAPKLLGPAEVNIKTKIGIFGPSAAVTPVIQPGVEAAGNSGTGITNELFEVGVKRYVDNRLFVNGTVGINSNSLTGQPGVQGNLGLGYDFAKDFSLDVSGGKNDSGQDEVRGFLSKRWELPNIANPGVGDKVKPHFLKVNSYVLIPGKFQLNWETDKYTKSVVTVRDPDGNEVKKLEDGFSYDHQRVVDGLSGDPDVVYKVRILAIDTSGNQAETITTLSGARP